MLTYESMADDSFKAQKRGAEMDPLSSGINIFRAIRKPKDERAGQAFRLGIGIETIRESLSLSSDDKVAVPPSLSVYAEGLTTPSQCVSLMTAPEKYSHVARIGVDKVRQIHVQQTLKESPDYVPVDVLWIKANDPIPAGAEGHCGIVGLQDVSGFTAACKSIRRQLADLAASECKTPDEWGEDY